MPTSSADVTAGSCVWGWGRECNELIINSYGIKASLPVDSVIIQLETLWL